MPRGIYKRKNGKMGKAKKVVQDYANPIQVLADEVVAMRKKAMTAGSGKVVTWNSNDPNYLGGAVGAGIAEQYNETPKSAETIKNEQLRIENEQMKEYLSNTRRVLVDRVNTIIILLENLKSSL